MLSRTFLLPAAVLLAAMVPASAAERGDAAAGKVLAERLCASCHVIGPDATGGMADVPSFPAIAAAGGDISAPWLAFRLLKPHPQMPAVALTRAEAADLSVYLASLRK